MPIHVESKPLPDSEMIQVQFQPTGKRVELKSGASLLEAARHAGIELNSTCGGEGTCGKCQVIVLHGSVSAPDGDEAALINQPELARGRRLACRAQAESDIIVDVPVDSIMTSQRLQIESDIN